MVWQIRKGRIKARAHSFPDVKRLRKPGTDRYGPGPFQNPGSCVAETPRPGGDEGECRSIVIAIRCWIRKIAIADPIGPRAGAATESVGIGLVATGGSERRLEIARLDHRHRA